MPTRTHEGDSSPMLLPIICVYLRSSAVPFLLSVLVTFRKTSLPLCPVSRSFVAGELLVQACVVCVADQLVQLLAGLHAVQEAVLGTLFAEPGERFLYRLHRDAEGGHREEDQAIAERGKLV